MRTTWAQLKADVQNLLDKHEDLIDRLSNYDGENEKTLERQSAIETLVGAAEEIEGAE
jgi:hypothetical protein